MHIIKIYVCKRAQLAFLKKILLLCTYNNYPNPYKLTH